MKVLWFTWKDLKHPQSGGAESLNEEIAKCMVRDGHEVIFLVAGFPCSAAEDIRDGFKVIRLGNRFTVYWYAYLHYKRSFIGWADLVIDEMNTIPFFCKYYVREKNILLAYQLCREVWFYQMQFPLSFIGYMLEPIYLWLLRDRCVITESESTKQDMLRYSFTAEKISVIPVSITSQPVKSLDEVKKYLQPTLLSVGEIRAMKRTLDQINAFEIAKKTIPNLQIKIIGSVSSRYGKKFLRRIANSTYSQDIEYLGHVNEATKTVLMQKSHLILATSIKEGWGLIVTEANAQGTPAAVYDVDGLRDSVKNGKTGLISKENTPQGLADAIIDGLRNKEYAQLRKNAWLLSQSFTLEECYRKFSKGAGLS